jgi:hypothetical protein
MWRFPERVSALTLVAVLGPAVLGAGPLRAQADEASSAPEPGIPELSYLLGEWTLRSFSRPSPEEPFVEADYTTQYQARYLYDGLSILAEFLGQSRSGFYGVHLISRDSEGGLVHYYLNARANRRLEFRGKFENGQYTLSRPGGYSGGDFLYREIDSEIEPSSFVKHIYQSSDEGKTWVEGNYYFRFERIGDSERRNP